MLKKMKILLIVNLSLLAGSFFSGCSQKEIIVEYKTKYLCNKQSIYELPPLENLAIAEEEYERIRHIFDLDLQTIELYKKQVEKNNELCNNK